MRGRKDDEGRGLHDLQPSVRTHELPVIRPERERTQKRREGGCCCCCSSRGIVAPTFPRSVDGTM